MNKTIKFLVKKKDNNKRLDVVLSKEINFITRSFIKKLILSGFLKINGNKILAPSLKIKANDEIEIEINEQRKYEIVANKIDLEIFYEDKDIAIINKPKGMVVHPGAGNYKNTLVNALMYKYKDNLSNINGSIRPGIVHRIDKDTSGLLVIAKNNLSHSDLSKQFSDHSIKRKYKCLIWGVIRPLNGKIETLISRNKKNRQLMAVSEIRGKKALTNYKTIEVFNIKDIPKISLLECELQTGRTHQIRVHLKYKGSSLIGDHQYGKKNLKFKKLNKEFYNILSSVKGQMLHAYTLEFNHPTKNKWLSFEAPLPKEFKKMLNLLNNLKG